MNLFPFAISTVTTTITITSFGGLSGGCAR
jgi:hypothetical protein